MPALDDYKPGTRIYASRTFTRAAGETDSLTGSTGTVILKDPAGTTIATLAATVSVAVGGASLTATYEHTLAADSVVGVWSERWSFADVLVVVQEYKFRVSRLR